PELATAPPPAGPGDEVLSADEVRALEPLLTGPILGGVLARGDAQVNNPQLAPALIRAAVDLGARVLTDTPVAAVTGSAGKCTGVRTVSGAEIAAGKVIVASGAWSAALGLSSGFPLPVEPWRGQMLGFDAP